MNEFKKHENITKILGLDLTCPHCEEILIKADERKEERDENRDVK